MKGYSFSLWWVAPDCIVVANLSYLSIRGDSVRSQHSCVYRYRVMIAIRIELAVQYLWRVVDACEGRGFYLNSISMLYFYFICLTEIFHFICMKFFT